MNINIYLGNRIGVTASSDTQNWEIELTKELLGLISDLSRIVESARPDTAEDVSRKFIEKNADNSTLLGMVDIFPKWSVNKRLEEGSIINFNGEIYRSQKDHITEDEQTPFLNDELYEKIESPDRPSAFRYDKIYGKGEAIRIGDTVLYSLEDDNNKSPDEGAWDRVTQV